MHSSGRSRPNGNNNGSTTTGSRTHERRATLQPPPSRNEFGVSQQTQEAIAFFAAHHRQQQQQREQEARSAFIEHHQRNHQHHHHYPTTHLPSTTMTTAPPLGFIPSASSSSGSSSTVMERGVEMRRRPDRSYGNTQPQSAPSLPASYMHPPPTVQQEHHWGASPPAGGPLPLPPFPHVSNPTGFLNRQAGGGGRRREEVPSQTTLPSSSSATTTTTNTITSSLPTTVTSLFATTPDDRVEFEFFQQVDAQGHREVELFQSSSSSDDGDNNNNSSNTSSGSDYDEDAELDRMESLGAGPPGGIAGCNRHRLLSFHRPSRGVSLLLAGLTESEDEIAQDLAADIAAATHDQTRRAGVGSTTASWTPLVSTGSVSAVTFHHQQQELVLQQQQQAPPPPQQQQQQQEDDRPASIVTSVPEVRPTLDLLREQRDPNKYRIEWIELSNPSASTNNKDKKWDPSRAGSVLNGGAAVVAGKDQHIESKLDAVILREEKEEAGLQECSPPVGVKNEQERLAALEDFENFLRGPRGEEQGEGGTADHDGTSTPPEPTGEKMSTTSPANAPLLFPPGQDPQFRTKLSDPPGPRSGHTTTFVPAMNSLIVYGGTASVEGFYNEAYQLDLKDGAWYKIDARGSPPPGTFGHTANLLSDGKTLFVYGGQSTNFIAGSMLHFLDLVSCVWYTKPVLKAVSSNLQDADLRRWGHSMDPIPMLSEKEDMEKLLQQQQMNSRKGGFTPGTDPCHPDVFLLFAGMNELVARNDILIVDARTGLVQQFLMRSRQDPPARRRHTMTPFRDHYLIMFGGRNLYRFLNDLWVFHIPTGVWVAIRKTTSPSSIRSFFALGPRSDTKTALRLCLELPHCAVPSRSQGLIAAPPPRTGHTSFLHNDVMYIISGYETDGVYDDIYAYDILNNTWSVVSMGNAYDKLRSSVTYGNNVNLLPSSSSSTGVEMTAAPFQPRSMGTATLIPSLDERLEMMLEMAEKKLASGGEFFKSRVEMIQFEKALSAFKQQQRNNITAGGSTDVQQAGAAPAANPCIFLYGGRNIVSLGDCYCLKVHHRVPSLFRLCAQFLVDTDTWDKSMDSGCSLELKQSMVEVSGPANPPCGEGLNPNELLTTTATSSMLPNPTG